MSASAFGLAPPRSLTHAVRWQLKDKPQPHPTIAAIYLPRLAGLSRNTIRRSSASQWPNRRRAFVSPSYNAQNSHKGTAFV
jgi:hypothetical protein